MKIKLSIAKKRLSEVLQTSKANKKDINTKVAMRMEYDLHKNRFSGFDEIENVIDKLKKSNQIKYEIVVDKPSVKLINGHGRAAELIGLDTVNIVSKMAIKSGIAVVGIFNSTYHGILETYTRKIAQQDLIAIVMANGGP